MNDEERTDYRYGCWGGNPKGKPQDPNKCVKGVRPDGWIQSQCSRKRGHGKDGLYCKQHAKHRPAIEGESCE